MKTLFLFLISSLCFSVTFTHGTGCGAATLGNPQQGSQFNKPFSYNELANCTNGIVRVRAQENGQNVIDGDQSLLAGSPYCPAQTINGCDFSSVSPITNRLRGRTATGVCTSDGITSCSGDCNLQTGAWVNVNSICLAIVSTTLTTTSSVTTTTSGSLCLPDYCDCNSRFRGVLFNGTRSACDAATSSPAFCITSGSCVYRGGSMPANQACSC